MKKAQRPKPSLFGELRRRRLFQTTAAYAVFVFISLQVAQLVLPALKLPAGTYNALVVVLLAAFPVVFILSWIFDITPEGLRRTLPFMTDSAPDPVAAALDEPPLDPNKLDSIAVLPFVDMSPAKDQEYFSDGLTEELLNLLAKRNGLRVAARTSSFAFKGRNEDVREIGRKLRVATVLEGSIRKSGNRLRVSALLIKTVDGFRLWSETYDRELEDIFDIQDEISRAIVSSLQLALADEAPAIKRTVLPAHELYLLGLFHYNKMTEVDVVEAVSFFQRAIDEDPSYAQAYVGLARAYSWQLLYQRAKPLELLPRARDAAVKAQQLDPALSEAYAARGYVEHHLDWNLEAAEQSYRRALDLNPNLAHVYGDRAELLWSFARLDESYEMVRQGLALDPLSIRLHVLLAVTLLFQRNYDASVEVYERAIPLCQGSPLIHLWIAVGPLMLARYADRAESELAKFAELSGEDPAGWTVFARALVSARERAPALARLAELPPDRLGGSYMVAGMYAMLGETEQAIDWLETAVDERQVYVHSLLVEPWFADMHEHPRFMRLLQRTGLARIKREAGQPMITVAAEPR